MHPVMSKQTALSLINDFLLMPVCLFFLIKVFMKRNFSPSLIKFLQLSYLSRYSILFEKNKTRRHSAQCFSKCFIHLKSSHRQGAERTKVHVYLPYAETHKKNWAGQHSEFLYWTSNGRFKSKMNLPFENFSKIALGALTINI